MDVKVCQIKFIRKKDLPALVEMGWDEKELLKVIKQRKTEVDCDTRVYTVYSPNEKEIWGGFALELEEGQYSVLKTVFLPTAPFDEVLEDVAGYLQAKAHLSKNRRKVEVVVPDSDYRLLGGWQKYGFHPTLSRRYYDDGSDAWICTFEAPDKEKD